MMSVTAPYLCRIGYRSIFASVLFVTLGWILVTGFLLLVALGFVRVVF
ncbi:MAG: hypothetical protein GX932_08555 [Methanomicrobiales archaeon]|nr:hypothetical protein [Methanomicrobiales archaeon]